MFNPYFYMKPTTLAEIVKDMAESSAAEGDDTYRRILRAAYLALRDNVGREEAHRMIGFDPQAEHIAPLPEVGDFFSTTDRHNGNEITGMVMRFTYDVADDRMILSLQTDPDNEEQRHWTRLAIPCAGWGYTVF